MAARVREYTTKDVIWTPFGVDCAQFNGDGPNAARADIPLTIGTVRPLEQGYGIEHLIQAFAVLRSRPLASGLRLLIVGDGAERRPLERLASTLGVGAVTEFVGAVPHDRIPDYLRRFSVYVAPSVHEESFGVAVLEASACGVPVIASKVGGLPEVVQDGMTGVLVPPADHVALADAIEGLLTNGTLRRQMGEQGRRFVHDSYAWDTTALTMEALYDRIVSHAVAGAAP
jgi:glycosyltransferase involved in cell wall biosynthesis